MVKWLRRFFTKRKEEQGLIPQEEIKENPFLPYFRTIIEQILEQYKISYQNFRPLILDRDTPPESMLSEDDVELVLEQISDDLNFLRIATERPAYFSDYIEKMYEENGLVVQVEEKRAFSLDAVNVVLDMEQGGGISRACIRENICYIPIYKKTWNQGKNLDISVPIGYNTVIVKRM